MVTKIKYIFFCFFVLNIGLVLYYFNQRNIFHTDEQWSYAHANSTQGAYLSPNIDSYFVDAKNDISYKWLDGKVFHDYLTVQKDEQFRYGHIWENLKKDVHPPLYYVLIHTVCSFFPDVFNKWQVGVINILFFALALLMLYKLSKLVLQDDVLALIPVFLWGFSNVGIGTAMYLRMYMMQTFFAVGLVYEVLLLLKENKISSRRLGMVYLYSALGILTQYNSLIFSFFVAFACGIVLLYRKNWRLLFGFGGCMLLSAVTLFVIFPDAYDVLLHSQRGAEIGERTYPFNSFLWWVLRLERLEKFYFEEFLSFPNVENWIWVIMVMLIFMTASYRGENAEIRLLLFVSLAFGVVMACVMPNMYVFWARYVMVIMPFVAILTMYLIIQGCRYLSLPKSIGVVVCAVLVIANSLSANFSKRSAFSFEADENTSALLEEIKQKKLIVASGVGLIFAGSSLYADGGAVFRINNICYNVEKRVNADYILVFNSFVSSLSGSIDKRLIDARCARNLKFISVIKLSADTAFDLYEVLE